MNITEFSSLIKESADIFNTTVKIAEELPRHLENDDPYSLTIMGLLDLWMEIDSTVLIINQPVGGWGHALAMPNAQETIERWVREVEREKIPALGVRGYDSLTDLGITLKVKECLTLNNPLMDHHSKRPIYLMFNRTFTEFTQVEQVFILKALRDIAVGIMAHILMYNDDTKTPNITS